MRLLGLATSVDLAGVMTVSIPYIGASGKPPPTPFVGEGLPLPVADLMFSGVTVGPNGKNC